MHNRFCLIFYTEYALGTLYYVTSLPGHKSLCSFVFLFFLSLLSQQQEANEYHINMLILSLYLALFKKRI